MAETAEHLESPALCRWIRKTREGLLEKWKEEHPGERDNPYTQRAVAHRIGEKGVTEKTYGEWERKTEPPPWRLRHIALALNLREDTFLPTGDLMAATARVEAEADQLAELRLQFADALAEMRSLLPPRDTPQAQPEHD